MQSLEKSQIYEKSQIPKYHKIYNKIQAPNQPKIKKIA